MLVKERYLVSGFPDNFPHAPDLDAHSDVIPDACGPHFRILKIIYALFGAAPGVTRKTMGARKIAATLIFSNTLGLIFFFSEKWFALLHIRRFYQPTAAITISSQFKGRPRTINKIRRRT